MLFVGEVKLAACPDAKTISLYPSYNGSLCPDVNIAGDVATELDKVNPPCGSVF
jgi:hypothetical protein